MQQEVQQIPLAVWWEELLVKSRLEIQTHVLAIGGFIVLDILKRGTLNETQLYYLMPQTPVGIQCIRE